MGVLRGALGAFHQNRFFGWVLLLAYAALVSFPHQLVQDVVGAWAEKHTLRRLYQTSVAIALIEAALIIAVFYIAARRIPGSSERRWLWSFWVLTFGLMVGAWKLFMANNTELVHYPQYFPEGMMLLALTASPAESLGWISILGGLDEAYQYTFLVKGRPMPFDFNDIYMDLLGGAAGVLFAMAILDVSRRERSPGWILNLLRRPGIGANLAVAAAGVLLWATGKMVLFEEPGIAPHWFSLSRLKVPTFWYFSPGILGPHHFHELSPIEGPVVILATIAVYSVLDRRLRIDRI